MILVTILHIVACAILIVVVLMQSGKGGMGGAFGGGGNTQSVFGGSGSGGFLQKVTSVFGAVFMITSIALAWASTNRDSDAMRRLGDKEAQAAKARRDVEEAGRKKANEAQESLITPDISPETPGSDAITPPPLTVPGDSPGAANTPAPTKNGTKFDSVGGSASKANMKTQETKAIVKEKAESVKSAVNEKTQTATSAVKKKTEAAKAATEKTSEAAKTVVNEKTEAAKSAVEKSTEAIEKLPAKVPGTP